MPRVLLIDDDRNIRRMLRRMLEREGYAVADERDGDEAVRRHRTEPADVIVTDILMPGKEGLETIRELLRADPGAKIIAISGGGRIGAASCLKWAERFGARRTLTKPFDPGELLETIRELAGERRK